MNYASICQKKKIRKGKKMTKNNTQIESEFWINLFLTLLKNSTCIYKEIISNSTLKIQLHPTCLPEETSSFNML